MSNDDSPEDPDTPADAEIPEEELSKNLFVRPELEDTPVSDPETDRRESEQESVSQHERDTDLPPKVREDDPQGGDIFEKIDVSNIDPETVWDTLGSARQPTVGGAAQHADPDGPVEHVVDKQEYCQDCPYFTEPPETACTHETATIVSVVDSDRFRVRDCPMVDPENDTTDWSI